MLHKRIYVIFLLVTLFVFSFGMVTLKSGATKALSVQLPNFKLPWDSKNVVNITSGPHAFGMPFLFDALYPIGAGSGLDFGNDTNFPVLSMADGTVIKVFNNLQGA